MSGARTSRQAKGRREPPPRGRRRRTVKRILLIVIALVMLAFPVAALAHPLGNFTINRYSRIEPSGDRVFVLYVLDMAEIPTFQAQATVHADGTGVYARKLAASIARELTLSLGGRRLVLRPLPS